MNPAAEGSIFVSREARELVRRGEQRVPIRKRFLGSDDEDRGSRLPGTRTLIILVPGRVVQYVYLRYGVIYVSERIPSVSAPSVPIPLGDTRNAFFQQSLESGPSWIGPGGHSLVNILQEQVHLIIPSATSSVANSQR